MSGCYAYCVVPAGHLPPAGLRGVADAHVTSVEASGVLLWVAPLAARPAPCLDAIRRHNAVVEAAVATGTTPVPIRFGQWLPDRAALLRHAAERAPAWQRQLLEFSGMCEVGVRAAPRGPAPAREMQQRTASALSPGRAHMERLAAERARRALLHARGLQLVGTLRDRVGSILARERLDPRPEGVVSAAHLVPRTAADHYLAVAATVSDEFADLDVTITGPWPPYSFVE